MKHKITLLLSVVAVIAGLIIILHDHNIYLTNNKIKTQAHALAVKVEQAKNTATLIKDQDQLTSLQKQCELGVQSYSLLTISQRLKVAEPNCTL